MPEEPRNRVFISSTTEDLVEHRQAVVSVLHRLEQEPVLLENPMPDTRAPLGQSRDLIDSCDLFIGLIAWRYGYVPERDNPEGRSFVELEHRYAWEIGKPTLVFMTADEALWSPRYIDYGDLGARQKRFRGEVMGRVTVGFFRSPSDLAETVSVSVARWLTKSHQALPAPEISRASRHKMGNAKEAKGTAPEAVPDDVDPFELAWRLVVDRKADPALLRHLDEDHLKKAVDDWVRDGHGPSETSAYRAAQEQLRKKQSGLAPHPLWLAWIRTTRPSFVRASAVPVHV